MTSRHYMALRKCFRYESVNRSELMNIVGESCFGSGRVNGSVAGNRTGVSGYAPGLIGRDNLAGIDTDI